MKARAGHVSKRDLAAEILMVAIVSAAMVAFRYQGGWVKGNPGFLDCLGIIATCCPATPVPRVLVVWLLRFGVSCIAACLIFWKCNKKRGVNYTLTFVATFVVSFVMGLGEVNFGGD
jgi:hypothetical protein